MFNLTGKTALITGATGGIGSEIAKVFVDHGAKVFISGMEKIKLDDLKNSLGEGCVGYHIADLSDNKAVEALYKAAVDALSQVDILVNSAGIVNDKLFMRVTDEDWNFHMQINLNSVWKLSQLAIRGMVSKRYGRVITLSSVVGCMGNVGQVAYSTSKAALLGMTKTLAKEVASRNITVNAIAPGFIQTPMTDNLLEKHPEILNNVPMGRAGTAREVAASALYLASEESAYTTGTTAHINGGMLMC